MNRQSIAATPAQLQFHLIALIAETAPGKDWETRQGRENLYLVLAKHKMPTPHSCASFGQFPVFLTLYLSK